MFFALLVPWVFFAHCIAPPFSPPSPTLRSVNSNLTDTESDFSNNKSNLDTFTEPGASLFPLALGTPQLPVFHSIHFSALFGVAPRSSDRGLGRTSVWLGTQPDVLARRLI